jgi:hypothetical protein
MREKDGQWTERLLCPLTVAMMRSYQLVANDLNSARRHPVGFARQDHFREVAAGAQHLEGLARDNRCCFSDRESV